MAQNLPQLLLFYYSWLCFVLLCCSSTLTHAQPIPSATFDNVPGSVFVGSSFEFEIAFDNAASSVIGYGPVVDFTLPSSLLLTGTPTIFGQILPQQYSHIFPLSTEQCISHPFAANTTVCGTGGSSFHSFVLPFSSFAPDQPVAEISLSALLQSAPAQDGSNVMSVRGLFRYGTDELDNPVQDPVIAQTWAERAGVEAATMEVFVRYNVPEKETAVGPSFGKTVTVGVEFGNDVFYSQVDFEIVLDDQHVPLFDETYLTNAYATLSSVSISNDASGTTVFFQLINSTASSVSYTLPYYIDNVLTPEGDWKTGETSLAVTATKPVLNEFGNETTYDTLTGNANNWHWLKPIAVRHISSVNIRGGSTLVATDIVKYTLQVDVSDFYKFDNVSVSYHLPDGQLFVRNFSVCQPRMTMSSVTYDVQVNYSRTLDTPLQPAGDSLEFLLSPVLQNSSSFIGPKVVQLTFCAHILEEYSEYVLTNDLSVDQGDVLYSHGSVQGDVFELTERGQSGNFDLTRLYFGRSDNSGKYLTISYGKLDHSIYAVDGIPCTPQPCPLQRLPSQKNVTLRILYDMPAADFEGLSFELFLQAPLLAATQLSEFRSNSYNAADMIGGVLSVGPQDTFFSTTDYSISQFQWQTDTSNNLVDISVGTYDTKNLSNPHSPRMLDLLLTFSLTTKRVPDEWFVANVLNSFENLNPSWRRSQEKVTYIQSIQPQLKIYRGLVAVNDSSALLIGSVSPVPFAVPQWGQVMCPQFENAITSSALALDPISASAELLQGQTRITVVTIVENIGHAGAYNIHINDESSFPEGYVIDESSLCVTYGNRNLVSPTGYSGNFFSDGLTFSGPLADDSAGAGDNILVIAYQVDLLLNISLCSCGAGSANITGYGNAPTGENHVLDPLDGDQFNSTIAMTSASPGAALFVYNSSSPFTDGNQVEVEETIVFQGQLTLPRGGYSHLNVTFNSMIQNNKALRISQVDVHFVGSGVQASVSPAVTPYHDTNGDSFADEVTVMMGPLLVDSSQDQSNQVVTFLITTSAPYQPTQNIAGTNLHLDMTAEYCVAVDGACTVPPVTIRRWVKIREPQLTIDVSKVSAAQYFDYNEIVDLRVSIAQGTYNDMTAAKDLLLDIVLPPTISWSDVTSATMAISGSVATELTGLRNISIGALDVSQTVVVDFSIQISNNNMASMYLPVVGTLSFNGGSDMRSFVISDDAEFFTASPVVTLTQDTSSNLTTNAFYNSAFPDVMVDELVTLTATVSFPNLMSRDVHCDLVLFTTARFLPVSYSIESVGSNLNLASSTTTTLLDSNSDNIDNVVRFTFGDVSTLSTLSGYASQMDNSIVLQVIARPDDAHSAIHSQNGRQCTQSAQLSYTGNTTQPKKADVYEELVLPQLRVLMSATPTTNLLTGTEITYFVTIEHTAGSRAPAYRLSVSDAFSQLENQPFKFDFLSSPSAFASPSTFGSSTTQQSLSWQPTATFLIGDRITFDMKAILLKRPEGVTSFQIPNTVRVNYKDTALLSGSPQRTAQRTATVTRGPCDNPVERLRTHSIPELIEDRSGFLDSDVFWITINSTLVNERTDAVISLVNITHPSTTLDSTQLSEQCNYYYYKNASTNASPYWYHQLGDNCKEYWQAKIPWQHMSDHCGLQRDETAAEIIYRGLIHVQQWEDLGSIRGTHLTRQLQTWFRFEIRFPKSIDLEHTITVFAPIDVQPAITRIQFESDIRIGGLDLFTSVQYPFVLNNPVVSNVDAAGVFPSLLSSDNSLCSPNGVGDACEQLFSFQLDPQGKCDLTGNYTLVTEISCQAGIPDIDCPVLPNTIAEIRFTVDTNDPRMFCGVFKEVVDVNGELRSTQSNYITPKSNVSLYYQTQYYRAEIWSDEVTIDEIQLLKLTTIRQGDESNGTQRILWENGATTSLGTTASLEVDEYPTSAPFVQGRDVLISFQVNDASYPLRDSDIDLSVIWVVEAEFRVRYTGNALPDITRKRSEQGDVDLEDYYSGVVVVKRQLSRSQVQTQRVVVPVKRPLITDSPVETDPMDDKNAKEPSNGDANTPIYIVLGVAAAFCLCVLVVVGVAAYRHKRNTKPDSDKDGNVSDNDSVRSEETVTTVTSWKGFLKKET